MKTISSYFPNLITYFFVLLFTYASISKLLDFENFQVQIAQSPLLSAYAGFISYFTIVIELFCVVLLIVPKMRLLGLYMSLGLMAAFSIYIYLILNYSDFVPCSCGGILEKMGWKEHLIFNIVCVFMAVGAISILSYQKGTSTYHSIVQQFVSIVFSCCLVVYLFYSSEYIIKKENNFTRRFMMHPILKDLKIDLGSSNYYFAGFDKDHIFLGNRKYPQKITIYSRDLKDKDSLIIELDQMKYPFRNLQLSVKSPFYFLADGSIPIIYRGKLGNPSARTISYQDAFFNKAIPLDSSNFVVRTQSRKDNSLLIAGLNLDEKTSILQLHPAILQKQFDGVFDLDGYFAKDNNSEKTVYVYNYRNQFVVLNKNLAVIARNKTIDTTNGSKTQYKALSNGSYKLSSPSQKTNGLASMYKNLVLIQSNLRGKHESTDSWRVADIIDVYDYEKSSYEGSIYLEKENNQSIRDLIFTNDALFSLAGSYLIKYKITRTLDKHIKKGEAENH